MEYRQLGRSGFKVPELCFGCGTFGGNDEFFDAWDDDFTCLAESIRDYGDVVIAVVRFTGHAKASGVEVAGGIFQVFRFREGQIVRTEDFTDHAEALKAAGVED